MKIKLLIIAMFFVSSSYSQTFTETRDWISTQSAGTHQIFYSPEDGQITFLTVRQAGNLMTTFCNIFDASVVETISTKKNKDGNYSLKLRFKEGGTIVTKMMLDKNKEFVGDVDEIKMFGWEISLETDESMILRYKKAFINLFKQIGVVVKDGDIF